MMSRVDVVVVDIFLRTSGCTAGKRRLLYLTYAELAVTSVFCTLTYLEMFNSKNELSVKMFNLILVQIETCMCVAIVLRLVYRRQFRDMDRFSKTVAAAVPREYREGIASITRFCIVGMCAVNGFPVLYITFFGSVKMGDHFTFPYLDVGPFKHVGDGNALIYACKYVLYTVPVCIAYVEIGFMAIVYVHCVGVLKARFEIIVRTIRDAMVNDDERKLKTAIKHHQDALRYFDTMKIVFAKPMMIVTVFTAVYLGLSSYFLIQAIQGVFNHLIFLVCVASGTAAGLLTLVYCFYGSKLLDFHDDILFALFDDSIYYASRKIKNLNLIMATRSTLPLQLKWGYVVAVDLNLLVRIMKISYSVLNVLLSAM